MGGLQLRRQDAARAVGYTLSVIPALWAFFMVGTTIEARALYLAMGFGGVDRAGLGVFRMGIDPHLVDAAAPDADRWCGCLPADRDVCMTDLETLSAYDAKIEDYRKMVAAMPSKALTAFIADVRKGGKVLDLGGAAQGMRRR